MWGADGATARTARLPLHADGPLPRAEGFPRPGGGADAPRELTETFVCLSCGQPQPASSSSSSPLGAPRSLHAFAGAGPMLPGGLAYQAAQRGSVMDEFDWVQDPVEQDLLRPEVAAALVHRCAEGVYGYGHFGIPCTTFTSLLALQRRVLRTRSKPLGRGGLRGKDKLDVDNANRLIAVAFDAMVQIVLSGGEVTFENVTDVGDPEISQCYWPERAAMCPLSLVPRVIAFSRWARVEQIHVPLASFWDGVGDAPPIKWVTLFATPGAASVLAPLRNRRVPAGYQPASAAIGRDEHGRSRAALSAAYPPGFCAWLSLVAARFAGDGRRDGPPAPPGAQVGCGHALHPELRRAIEAARAQPPRFADFRKLDSMPAGQRRRAAYPTPHAVDAESDSNGPDTSWAVLESGSDDERKESFAPGMLRPLRSHHGIPGLPPGRVTYEMIWRRMEEYENRREGYLRILTWTRLAFTAMPLLAAGAEHVSPGSLVIPPEFKEEWARSILLDTRDLTDVVSMRRSTRHTIFPGGRQMDRAAFRTLCDEVEWRLVDADIVDQCGEGGVETRSHCPRYSYFGWHHGGIRANFEEAHRISCEEYKDSWLLGPFPLPPTEPVRCIPNNVVMQQRPKLSEDGELLQRLKPRVTTNESYGDDASPNAGVAYLDKTTSLPSHLTHAMSTGITDACFRPSGYGAGQYCTDLTGAFSFLVTQRADWWQQVRFWLIRCDDGSTRCGYFLQPRTLFGGTWGPNRFMRVQRAKRCRVRRRQRAFDAAHPYPPEVLRVVEERTELQTAGGLAEGADQLFIASLQEFIDDESGSAGMDPVPMPAELQHVDIDAVLAQTAASGGRPAPRDSRVAVHCCFSIDESERVRFEHAMDKAQCGDGIVVLGLRCDAAADRSDCPPVRAQVMTAELRAMLGSMAAGQPIERSIIERNTGRLSNLSQIEPALLFDLHAGYALSAAMTRGSADRPRCRLRRVPVRAGSGVGAQFRDLLTRGMATLAAGHGVPLCHAPCFYAHGDDSVVTVVTDASGDEAVGGFGFHPAFPEDVWIVHSPWSAGGAEVAEALAYAARTQAEKRRQPPQPSFSMPSAEAFGGWAVAEAVRLAGAPIRAVIAVGDCKPAAQAMSAAKSRSRVMRGIVAAARASVPAWLGVHVLRQWNSDADYLTHPLSVAAVVAAARAAGLRVHESAVPELCWERLRALLAEAFAASLPP